jgi:hypothetical protein
LQPQGLPPVGEGGNGNAQFCLDLGNALPLRRTDPPPHISFDGLAVSTHRSFPQAPGFTDQKSETFLKSGDWHLTLFTNILDRLLNAEVMAGFPELLLAAPEVTPLLSWVHFSVDAPLLQVLSSKSSLERIDRLDEDPLPPTSGKGFGGECATKGQLEATSATCCSTARPIAPAPMSRLGC